MNFEVYDFGDLALVFKEGVCVSQHIHDVYYDVMAKLSAAQFLETRVMPACRWNSEMSEFFDIPDWDPEKICRLTHGYKMLEPVWIKFPEDHDTINYDEVKLQLW